MTIRWLHFVASASALGVLAFVGPAQAQYATQTVDGITISAGGGLQWVDLPALGLGERRGKKLEDWGGAFSGEVSSGLGYWGSMPVTGAVRGHYASVEARRREADLWNVALEARFGSTPNAPVSGLYRNDYFIVGADIRGIDQTAGGTVGGLRNRESLDTTYAGGFVGISGEYDVLGFFGFGIGSRLGLRSFATARAGLYGADADYRGNISGPGGGRLSLSEDKTVFIGSLTFETRKQIGQRSSLSLITDYEYYSWAPEMRYANGPTRIDDGDAFNVRTVLRLNIGLGPSSMYSQPAYLGPSD
jgi:hypothetical protein